MIDLTNTNKVKYNYGDKVYFGLTNPLTGFKVLEGTVDIIDAHGTFFRPGEPSYDIMVEDYEIDGKAAPCLFKHWAQHTVFDNEHDCILYWQVGNYDKLGEEEQDEVNKNLIDKYPFLQLREDYYGSNWLNMMPAGWRRRIGMRMCEELGECNLTEFAILEVKEKYGALRVYYTGGDEQVDKVIRKYEKQSTKICWKCGDDARYRSTGWILPWCSNCAFEDHFKTHKGTDEEFEKRFEKVI